MESKLEFESKKVVAETISTTKQKSNKPIKMTLAQFQKYNENNSYSVASSSSSLNQSMNKLFYKIE